MKQIAGSLSGRGGGWLLVVTESHLDSSVAVMLVVMDESAMSSAKGTKWALG